MTRSHGPTGGGAVPQASVSLVTWLGLGLGLGLELWLGLGLGLG